MADHGTRKTTTDRLEEALSCLTLHHESLAAQHSDLASKVAEIFLDKFNQSPPTPTTPAPTSWFRQWLFDGIRTPCEPNGLASSFFAQLFYFWFSSENPPGGPCVTTHFSPPSHGAGQTPGGQNPRPPPYLQTQPTYSLKHSSSPSNSDTLPITPPTFHPSHSWRDGPPSGERFVLQLQRQVEHIPQVSWSDSAPHRRNRRSPTRT